MADSTNALSTQDPRARVDSHLRDDPEKYSFAATLDWRQLGPIAELSVRRSAIAKSTTILRQGQIASSFFVVVDGWGLRYKQLDDGRRQILCFLLPGDPATLAALSPHPLSHSVQLLPDCVVSEFDVAAMNEKLQANEDFRACINASYQRELAMADELLVTLGRRTAKERIAHLMLEFDARLNMRGDAPDGYIFMPLRQRHLADALGLTTIHVNRTLRAMRDEKLIDVRGGKLRILDRPHLAALAGFDGAYLAAGAAPA